MYCIYFPNARPQGNYFISLHVNIDRLCYTAVVVEMKLCAYQLDLLRFRSRASYKHKENET